MNSVQNQSNKQQVEAQIEVGASVFCPICGTRTKITMSYREYDPQDKDALSTGNHRFHCSVCGSNIEFRLIWDWDIDKTYR